MTEFRIDLSKSKGYTRLSGKPSSSSLSLKLSYAFSVILSPYLLLLLTLFYINAADNFTSPYFSKFVLKLAISVNVLGMLYYAQDALLYHPCGVEEYCYYVPKPVIANMAFEEVFLTTSDGQTIHGYFYKQPGDLYKKVPTVLVFHGNTGSIGFPAYLGFKFAAPCNILAIDYRGYGKSTSEWGISPSEEGLYQDGEAALDYLIAQDVNQIIVYGHSLGGAVAIHLATTNSDYISGLIVENTFTCIREEAVFLFDCLKWLLRALPDFCYKNKFNSIAKISGLCGVPALFISGNKDKIVPYKMSKQLCDACVEQRHQSRWVVVNGRGHNDTVFSPIWCDAVTQYMNEFFPSVALPT